MAQLGGFTHWNGEGLGIASDQVARRPGQLAQRIALGRRGRELRCQLARVLVHEAQRRDRH